MCSSSTGDWVHVDDEMPVSFRAKLFIIRAVGCTKEDAVGKGDIMRV